MVLSWSSSSLGSCPPTKERNFESCSSMTEMSVPLSVISATTPHAASSTCLSVTPISATAPHAGSSTCLLPHLARVRFLREPSNRAKVCHHLFVLSSCGFEFGTQKIGKSNSKPQSFFFLATQPSLLPHKYLFPSIYQDNGTPLPFRRTFIHHDPGRIFPPSFEDQGPVCLGTLAGHIDDGSGIYNHAAASGDHSTLGRQ